MIKLWALENTHTRFSICTIDPGNTQTKLRKKAMPGEEINSLQQPVMVAKSIIKLIFLNTVYKGETIKLSDIH